MDEVTRQAGVDRRIREEIRDVGGTLSFARFMEIALYEPGLGYYESTAGRVGRAGDFYTSVSTGPLFGELLAERFIGWLKSLPHFAERTWSWVECGAHDGRLARDLLTALDRYPTERQHIEYVILESSEQRRAWQKANLEAWAGRVRWIDSLPAEGIHGVVFSNELLDAFPVHRIAWNARDRRWFEWGVGESDTGFEWRPMPADATALKATEWPDLPPELTAVLPDGFCTEVHTAATLWWHQAAATLRDGWLVTLDYGLDGLDFFQPQRSDGTLRAYHRHRISADLLANPGDQDLTAQVNFTALQHAGEAAGLTTIQRTGQRQWLTGILQETLEAHTSHSEHPAGFPWTPERTRQFQTLTHPDHLGRGFSVLVQRRTPRGISRSANRPHRVREPAGPRIGRV